MPNVAFSRGFLGRLTVGLPVALGLIVTLSHCAEVPDEPTDCMEPFCPVGSTACSTRPRPPDSDCAISGEVGKCDSSGNCVECNVPSQCTEDGNPCTAASCIDHQCGQSNVPDGTACSGGVGSCQAGVCESLTGTIEVRATLSAVGNGGDNSYTVLIDSVSRGTIGPGTPVSYGGFPVGSHNVLLQGIDGDGDVTPSGTRVFVDIVWSAGGTQSYESDGAFNRVTGN